MNCKISIRACPKPNDFFDEMIPDGGLRAGEWLLKLQRIRDIATTLDGQDVEVEIRWIYAETDCDPDHVKATLRERKPELIESLEALAAHRQAQLEETLTFTYWFEESVIDGVQGNIEPHKLNIGIRILNVQRLDDDGNVVSDARAESQQRARELAHNARQLAKNRIKENADYARFLNDPYYRRIWKSYGIALRQDDRIGQLYDLRDAAIERIPNAQKTLGFSNEEWKRFGLLLNNTPVTGGRHSGKQPLPLRPLMVEEKAFLVKFAQKLLLNFGKYLESEEHAQHGKCNGNPQSIT